MVAPSRGKLNLKISALEETEETEEAEEQQPSDQARALDEDGGGAAPGKRDARGGEETWRGVEEVYKEGERVRLEEVETLRAMNERLRARLSQTESEMKLVDILRSQKDELSADNVLLQVCSTDTQTHRHRRQSLLRQSRLDCVQACSGSQRPI